MTTLTTTRHATPLDMSFLYLFGTLFVLVPVLYMYTISVVGTRLPTLTNKRICLLIAHPDDEAMFFSPAVLALTRPETGNHLKILCLSSGNAEGLGETRKKELVKSALTLGLQDEDDVFVVDNPDFPDSMTTHWDSAKISNLLRRAFVPPPPPTSGRSKAADEKPPAVSIDALLTFDAHGVSGHPNHISLYRGARHFVASLVQGKPGWRTPVDLYTLTTVPVWRKYASVLDAVPTVGSAVIGAIGKKAAKHVPRALVFLSDLNPSATGGGLGTAWRAMTTAHKSQMVWFRYGWIALSRYMVVNDLRLEGNFGPADIKE